MVQISAFASHYLISWTQHQQDVLLKGAVQDAFWLQTLTL